MRFEEDFARPLRDSLDNKAPRFLRVTRFSSSCNPKTQKFHFFVDASLQTAHPSSFFLETDGGELNGFGEILWGQMCNAYKGRHGIGQDSGIKSTVHAFSMKVKILRRLTSLK